MEKKYSREVGYEVMIFENMIMRKITGIIQANGMGEFNVMQAWIMQYLYENRDVEIYQKDIERRFGIMRSTVTSILQHMEKNGYIRRVSVMKDARLKRILLTDKALDIQKKNFMEIHYGFESMIREGLSEEDMASFLDCIDKMKENISTSDYPNGDVKGEGFIKKKTMH